MIYKEGEKEREGGRGREGAGLDTQTTGTKQRRSLEQN